MQKHIYALHACLLFDAPLSVGGDTRDTKNQKIFNIGHYTAAVKRLDGTWQLYDDMTQSVIQIPPTESFVVHSVFYVLCGKSEDDSLLDGLLHGTSVINDSLLQDIIDHFSPCTEIENQVEHLLHQLK